MRVGIEVNRFESIVDNRLVVWIGLRERHLWDTFICIFIFGIGLSLHVDRSSLDSEDGIATEW